MNSSSQKEHLDTVVKALVQTLLYLERVLATVGDDVTLDWWKPEEDQAFFLHAVTLPRSMRSSGQSQLWKQLNRRTSLMSNQTTSHECLQQLDR